MVFRPTMVVPGAEVDPEGARTAVRWSRQVPRVRLEGRLFAGGSVVRKGKVTSSAVEVKLEGDVDGSCDGTVAVAGPKGLLVIAAVEASLPGVKETSEILLVASTRLKAAESMVGRKESGTAFPGGTWSLESNPKTALVKVPFS